MSVLSGPTSVLLRYAAPRPQGPPEANINLLSTPCESYPASPPPCACPRLAMVNYPAQQLLGPADNLNRHRQSLPPSSLPYQRPGWNQFLLTSLGGNTSGVDVLPSLTALEHLLISLLSLHFLASGGIA